MQKQKRTSSADTTESNETVKMVLKGDVALRNPGQPVNVEFPDFSGYELME